MTRTLQDLLALAGVTPHAQRAWFEDAVYLPPVLYVRDAKTCADVERLFGAAICQHRPQTVIQVKGQAQEPPRYLNAKGRKAWRGELVKATQAKLPS